MVFAVSSRRVVSLLGKEPLEVLEPLLMGHVRCVLLGGESGVFGRDDLVSLSLGVVMVTQHRLKQVQTRGEQRRAREQQEEDHHAGATGTWLITMAPRESSRHHA